jgi:hypothetical protein
MRRKIFFLCLTGFLTISIQSTAYAGFLNGLAKTVLAPFEIPKAILQQVGNLPFGPVTGALGGTFATVTGVTSGLGEMTMGAASDAVRVAKAAAPYAKYAWIFAL